MTDYFALLNFARAPWLEAEAVQARFLELSSGAHPDRAHHLPEARLREANQRFAELNAAAACLREPRDRLNHLIQLETGAAPGAAQAIPESVVELFARIGQTCRAVDQFLAERARAVSPVVQAQMFGAGLEWGDRISELQAAVAEFRQRAEIDLRTIDARWPAEKPMERLRELAHTFAMISRWEGQLQERFAALAAV